MILQALYDYYLRKAADPEGGMAPEGFEWKEIPFLCRLDQHGHFVKFEDTRESVQGKLRARKFRVPSLGEAKGSGIKANLLWENSEYIFGIPTKDASKPERVKAQARAFRQKISASFGSVLSPPFSELLGFLENLPLPALNADPLWQVIIQPSALLTFAMDGYGVLTEHPDVNRVASESDSQSESEGFCLITGQASQLTRLLPPIRGIRDANPTGATLVAVNNKIENGRNQGETPAFASYMKQQGFNSPIGRQAAEGFSKALNHLLDRNSANKVQVGDATTVFWSDRRTEFEDEFSFLWSSPPKEDPDRGVKAVEAILRSPFTGAGIPDGDARFYVLGLSPNSARISVRFWHMGRVAEIARVIRQHFIDLDIVRPKNDRGNYALFFLLADIAMENKIENVPPNLAGDVMRSILAGSPYPATLLQQTIRRIRAQQSKQEVKRTQAAILKACLNRQQRFQSDPSEKEIQVALDSVNTNTGYRLGRLFALLEKIQEESSPGINSTIRDRYFGSASANPVVAFPILNRLSKHHLAKLENRGRAVNMDRLAQEIVDGLGADNPFPSTLNLADQGRFFVGYYHQRQALFTKSEKPRQSQTQGAAP